MNTVGIERMSDIIRQLADTISSPAFDAVSAASHPSPEAGGPCETCAFRPGTEASQTTHTVALVKLSIEGLVPFHCHERPQLCRGFIAAANLRGVPRDEEDMRRVKSMVLACEVLSDAIAAGVEADRMQLAEEPTP